MPPFLDAALDPRQWEMVARVALAMGLGALVGLERQLASKPAGLRTHMLVAGSGALVVSLGQSVIDAFPDDAPPGVVTLDPLRIIEAVIAGVSFLGAGTIITRAEAGDVQGLTTAASLLMAAGIGIAVGMLQVVVAIGTALLTLVVLRVVGMLESNRNGRTTS
jgi:putative Mg2+ transporter-C (MgtC) family protein